MRTSPEHVRRLVAPRALSVVLVGLLAVVGASCGDDGPEQTTPSTTAPPTSAPSTTAPPGTEGATTTTGGEGGTPTPSTAAPGDPADLLTPAEAEAELARILERYRVELQGAKQRNALDEQFQAGLASVLLPALRDNELDALQGIGAPGSLAATIAPVSLGAVEVGGGDGSCTSGTARIDFTPFYGAAAAGPRTYFFKMTTGEAAGGDWRLAAVGFTESGAPFASARCEEQSP
jgi:hypothetical protein